MDAKRWEADKGKEKHAVVTGGAGFRGSHLTAALLKQGFSGTIIDNLATGSRSNLAPLSDRGNLEFRRHDIIDPFAVEAGWIYSQTRSFCHVGDLIAGIPPKASVAKGDGRAGYRGDRALHHAQPAVVAPR